MKLRLFLGKYNPSTNKITLSHRITGTKYGHEIEMYTVEQGEKRDKRQ